MLEHPQASFYAGVRPEAACCRHGMHGLELNSYRSSVCLLAVGSQAQTLFRCKNSPHASMWHTHSPCSQAAAHRNLPKHLPWTTQSFCLHARQLSTSHLHLRLHLRSRRGDAAHALQEVEGHPLRRQERHCGPPDRAELGAFAHALAIC